MSSTSATKVSPTAPPATPAANLLYFDFLFKSEALPTAFCKLGFFKLAYFPFRLAVKALLASFCPALKPIPPGTAI